MNIFNAALAAFAAFIILTPQGHAQTMMPERAGYYDTVWPSEHTDLWRSHAVLDAGLPADFDPARLTVSAVQLNLPVWGYTREHDEIFITGGSPVALDAFTESYKYGVNPNPAAFLGNVLLSTLNPSIPYVAKIQPNSMDVAQQVFLTEGSTVNYTGGLLMHQNGFVYAVASSVLYKIHPDSMEILDSIDLPLVDAENPFWTTYNGLQVIASGQLVLKGYHFLNSSVPGWLLLIDPDDFSFDIKQQKPVLSARLTIDQEPDGETWLYHSNATQTLRFKITEEDFELDENWTQTYRVAGDGTTQASSPLFFGEIGQTVFANNTLPSPSQRFRLFTQPVDASQGQLEVFPAFKKSNEAGFNFYMIAGDPFLEQLVVYYDPINGLLSAHHVDAEGILTKRWESDIYRPSASPAISPDRDLLYIDDYTGERDEFVVLRLSTGDEWQEFHWTLPPRQSVQSFWA